MTNNPANKILRSMQLLLKRLLDIVLSVVTMLACLPIFITIAIMIKLDSSGPVIYRQERIGKHGKVFTIFKFRTMVADAEKGTPVWSKDNDSRVTRFGRLLRATNLDELPQLVNVLKNDMSIIGPRPERPHFTKEFSRRHSEYPRRHSVKPGITGWAQSQGLYGNSSIEKRMEYDLYYIDNWSLSLDLDVLIKTTRLFAKHFAENIRLQYK